MSTPEANPFSLTGRTALITGAGGLLGVQHALALLESGAEVVLTDVREEALQAAAAVIARENPAGQVLSIPMDVADGDSVRGVLEEITRLGKTVRVLVNNAAIDAKVKDTGAAMEFSRFENFPSAQWDRELDVGLKGAFLTSQAFGTEMARTGGGVILNVASDLSVIAPDQRLYRRDGLEEQMQPVKPVTYSVIKTALIGLTRYLAAYWAPSGVRVNAISPGGVFNGQPEDFVSRLSSLIPMGRMARVNEYRASVQYLCSDASGYLTGQNLVVDGGRSIL